MSKQAGKRVRTLREALKLSQSKFGDEIGVSISTIQKIEVGSYEADPGDILDKVSKKWECTWILDGKGVMTFTNKNIAPTNIYQDVLYKELKEVNEDLKEDKEELIKEKNDWKQKCDQLLSMLSQTMSGKLGKLKSLVPAGLLPEKRESRTGARM